VILPVIGLPPTSTLFPYTTLFRSKAWTGPSTRSKKPSFWRTTVCRIRHSFPSAKSCWSAIAINQGSRRSADQITSKASAGLRLRSEERRVGKESTSWQWTQEEQQE